ncbi:MAG: metal ABC transporter permease, partial [Lachnospiraceae bacterium]|nr:metal ABC transporter permease [Lachnospiraceae bacterium]
MISEMLKYEFMKNAFLAVLVITPLFGLLGTVVVSKKMAFFSDALGHSALTGMGIGVLLGIADTDLSMALFGVAFALLLNF